MNGSTLLLRQVHPLFVHGNRITSQVFSPRPSDGYRLSVYDGDQISAEESWLHYTEVQERESIGVVAVTFDECTDKGLQAYADPSDFQEHAVIDFGSMSKGQIKSVSKHLRSVAQLRDWLYQSGKHL